MFRLRHLLSFLALFSYLSPVEAQQRGPFPGLGLGDAVITGFSGTRAPDATRALPPGKSATDLTVIDPDGTSAEILDLSRPERPWTAGLLAAPRKFKVSAAEVGQVFGVAIGEPAAPATSPNIYLSATSAYGLHIARRGANGASERLKAGGPGAQWAAGQFGVALQGGPGSIYVIDGATGTVNLLANVTLDGVPNPGPGLGNLAYDGAHKQLFVSDLYTGMIHRIGLDGADLGRFDHGVTARTAAQLAPVAFDARIRANITNPAFEVDKPESWGLAPPARRVWAVTLFRGRLYYSVQEGLQVWSVGVQQDGNFAADARLETEIATPPGAMAITDIAFSNQGAMILAQRAAFGTGNYAYSAFTAPGEPRVLRFLAKSLADPPSPGFWRLEPQEIPVGLAGNLRNANGGVAFGYGYDAANALSLGACGQTLLATGEKLRLDPARRDQLAAGGPLAVDGLQMTPFDILRPADKAQPWNSSFVDYDEKFDENTVRSGWIGSVRTYAAPCPATGAAGAPALAAAPVGTATGTPGQTGGDPLCTGPECQPCRFGAYPDGGCRPPPIDLAIKKTAGEVKFDAATLSWTVQFTLTVSNAGIPFVPGNTISIQDAIPAGMTFVSATGAGWTCSGTLTCNQAFGAGLFNTGAALPPIVVTLSTKKPGKYQNCATTGVPRNSGLEEITLENNRDCATVELKYPPNNVTFEKIAPRDSCAVTDPCVFQFKVTNTSPWPYSGALTINDTSSVVMNVSSTDLPCNPQPTQIPFSCPAMVNLPAGPSSQTFTVTGVIPLGGIPVVNPPTSFENCASVADAPPMPGFPSTITVPTTSCKKYTACGFACHMTQYEIDRLKIEKKADATQCTAGGLCSYTFTITNLTSTPFSGPLSFIDTMPAGASQFVPPPTPAPWSCLPYNGSPDQTKCLIRPANVPANGSISVTVTFQIAAGYQPSTLTNCSEFFVGTNPATLRTANSGSRYGAQDETALKAYMTMRGLAPAKSTGAPPTLGADDKSCATVNITKPANSDPQTATLIVKKEIVNHAPAPVPATTYPVTVTCGASVTNLNLASSGAAQLVPGIPVNSTCSVVEPPPAVPANICGAAKQAVWTTDYIPPGATTVPAAGATITVRNTLSCVPLQKLAAPILPVVTPPGITPPKPRICAPPMVADASGECLCPQGTIRQGGRCLPRQECRAPMMPNADGSCACPPGLVRRGLQCIEPPRPPKCRPPMVQGAGGACVCPEGTQQRGRLCVRPTVCKAPARPNGRGGCACPPEMQPRGNSCIERPAPRPRITPGDAIRVVPGLIDVFRPGGGGGGRPSPKNGPGRP